MTSGEPSPMSGRPKIYASLAAQVEAHRARASGKVGVAAQHASIDTGETGTAADNGGHWH